MLKHSTQPIQPFQPDVAIIGAGPAGLMAAEKLIEIGCTVTVYDAMPSAGRKILQAGRGGFNITHSEPYEQFITRFGKKQTQINDWLAVFNADDLRIWAQDLGIETYIGSSGRVYPTSMQAAPFLRAWLHRLKIAGVEFKMRHRWIGWNENNQPIMEYHQEQFPITTDATLFALGGASWPKLGSNGAWVAPFTQANIQISPLLPANCGFNVSWSTIFAERFAGQPLKNIQFRFTDSHGRLHQKRGEAMLTQYGIEGSLTYLLSGVLRDDLIATGQNITLYVDLLPNQTTEHLQNHLQKSWLKKGKMSLSSFYKKAGISALHLGLLREVLTQPELQDMEKVAETLKQLPLSLHSTRPIEEVISSAGGVAFEALDKNLMLIHKPGVFCAGEMLDWEAPTGGYLLTAAFASGIVAANGILNYLQSR